MHTLRTGKNRVLLLQSEVAGDIAKQIDLELTPQQQSRIKNSAHLVNPDVPVGNRAVCQRKDQSEGSRSEAVCRLCGAQARDYGGGCQIGWRHLCRWSR